LRESLIILSLYRVLRDWELVRQQIIENNLLQMRALSSMKRSTREIVTRLKLLTDSEIELLVEGSPQDQRHLLWMAVCRCYEFVGEFARQVLRERFLSVKLDLPLEEFDVFFNRKCEWHAELDSIKPVTRAKLRQVLYRIMREADLLTEANFINAVMLSPRLMCSIESHNKDDLMFFPAHIPEVAARVKV